MTMSEENVRDQDYVDDHQHDSCDDLHHDGDHVRAVFGDPARNLAGLLTELASGSPCPSR